MVYEVRVGALSYIGVTVDSYRSPVKSLNRRWQKHVQRALAEDKSWRLSSAIRRYGAERFTLTILEVVRGKTNAHKVERELIKLLRPKLNTDVR